MQASPLFMMALGIIKGIETSRSASSRRIAADLPPNSRLNRLRLAPQAAPILRPAADEPVKDTLSTPGWLTRYSPTSRPAGTTLSTPLGRPASAKISANTLASRGVSGAGLNTTVLPDRRAGESLAQARNRGTFQGVMAATTPIGSLDTITGPSSPSRTVSNAKVEAMPA